MSQVRACGIVLAHQQLALTYREAELTKREAAVAQREAAVAAIETGLARSLAEREARIIAREAELEAERARFEIDVAEVSVAPVHVGPSYAERMNAKAGVTWGGKLTAVGLCCLALFFAFGGASWGGSEASAATAAHLDVKADHDYPRPRLEQAPKDHVKGRNPR